MVNLSSDDSVLVLSVAVAAAAPPPLPSFRIQNNSNIIMSASQFVLRALTCRSGPACAATRSRGLSKMASSSSLSSTRRVGGARVKPSMGYSASFSVGAVRRAGKESSLGRDFLN